jgi:hypothetical protein
VTGNDVPDVDMPNIPQPQRQDEPVMTDADLVALLAGTTDVAPGLRPVADVLAALAAEPTGMELAGEASALAEFRRWAGTPVPTRRANGRSSRLGVKVGASVTAVAVVLGGGAAAAFAGVLPAPIQRLAHEAIGAPIPPPQHPLPSRGGPAHGQSGVYGQSGVHGKPAARGGPGTNRKPRPHAAPASTAQGNPQGQGKQGNQGQEGQGSGQGQQGSGQGQQGSGHGQGNSQGQGDGQGQQGKGQQGPAQQENSDTKGPHGSLQANRMPAGHPRRSIRTRPVMDL